MGDTFLRNSRYLVVLLLLGLAFPAVNFSQTSRRESTRHEIDCPYYSVRDGFNSVLSLASNASAPQFFTVSVFSRSGKKVVAPATTIQPQEKASVDLGELLRNLSVDTTGEFADGSFAVNFTSDEKKAMAAQLLISNPVTGIHFTSPTFKNDNGQSGLPPTLHLLWWGLADGRDVGIVVTNVSSNPVVADVFMDFKGKHHPASPLFFSPHETKVLSVPDRKSVV
jgi:hypothetical protein